MANTTAALTVFDPAADLEDRLLRPIDASASPDPADPVVTARVITVMLAEEY